MSDNIVKAIKSVWAADGELNGLLPSTRIFAARSEGTPVRPYAVITHILGSPLFRTTKGNCDRELFQIAVYADRYDEAANIQMLMREVLRDATVTDTHGQVVLFEKATGERTFTEGGVTQVIEQFTADISTSRRA
jgi:hypothetical protein